MWWGWGLRCSVTSVEDRPPHGCGLRMPRGARLDAPGTLHHLMVRGIERRSLFWDDRDRAQFVRRLAAWTHAKAWAVDAWAL